MTNYTLAGNLFIFLPHKGALKARGSTAQGEGAREACDGTLIWNDLSS
jgi:hypothetical protein